MKKKLLKKILISLLLAVSITAAAGMGFIYDPDSRASDRLYNRPRAEDGLITVIGIDQKSLEELGPWPWTRDVMAQAIRALNRDPENRPAVIGIDVMYIGTTKESYDDALVQACAEGGNVVVGEAATFQSRLVFRDNEAYIDPYAIVAYDSAFPALREVTHTGHINAMPDTDGILRHAKLSVEPEGYGSILSFAAQIYLDYCESAGLTASLPETDENGFFYLPYSVRPGGYYDGVSISDLILGTVKGSRFAGKIVLIGPYAAGLQDQYFTPISRAEPMYGVEIQANTITALINGLHLREASDGWQLAVLAILTFGCTWFFLDRRLLWSFLGLVGTLGFWLLLCGLTPLFGRMLHPIWVPLAVCISFVAAITDNYLQASRERKRVSETFRRYVDPAIIGELMKEGTDSLELGGKLCSIAVLFVDIRGFTTMSEKLSPQEVVQILNRYLTLTTECVMRHNGTLDKYVGDCTMAIWNAPLQQEDYIMKACMAALDMVKGSAELNRELEQACGRSVSFGIGVHCGQAIVGNIGSTMRMDFTAIGDTVNTAARLESNAPGGTIYISRDVADALRGRIRATSQGTSIALKGKAQSVEIFTLQGLADEETPS